MDCTIMTVDICMYDSYNAIKHPTIINSKIFDLPIRIILKSGETVKKHISKLKNT